MDVVSISAHCMKGLEGNLCRQHMRAVILCVVPEDDHALFKCKALFKRAASATRKDPLMSGESIANQSGLDTVHFDPSEPLLLLAIVKTCVL